MKILIIDESGIRFEREADEFSLDGRSISLYRKKSYEDDEIARPESTKLIAAYWGITGFEVLEE